MIAVFLGPSLPAREARRLLPDARVFPPARQGDVWRALARRPRAIALIDGVFESQPSVWHREILDALDAGVPVVGAASMGALRAAELAGHGMRGVGRIYRWYRDGVVRDDAEVALLHADAEQGYRPLTVPLVNVRWAAEVARRRGVLRPAEARALVNAAAEAFYQERTWDLVLRALPAAARMRWERFRPPDLKADDARAGLAAAGRVRASAAAPQPRLLPAHARRRRLLDVRLPHAPELVDQGLRRLLLAGIARAYGLAPTPADLRAAEQRWIGGRDRERFLAAQGLDEAEARRIVAMLALERLALDHAARLIPDGPSSEEGLALEARLRGLLTIPRAGP